MESLRPSLVDWLANRVTLLSGLIHWFADRVWNLFRPSLVHWLANRIALLSGLVHWLANRVWNLFRPSLVDRLANRVALLSSLIHWLANRVWNLFRPSLVDWLANRIRNSSCTSLPNWLADCVFDITVALLFFITNTVDFLLLDHLFAYGFVTRVLFFLVDNVLDEFWTTT